LIKTIPQRELDYRIKIIEAFLGSLILMIIFLGALYFLDVYKITSNILIVSYLILNRKYLLELLTFLGLVFIFELHHLIKAVISLSYYPGMITGLLFPIIGFFYWKELIKNWKHKRIKIGVNKLY